MQIWDSPLLPFSDESLETLSKHPGRIFICSILFSASIRLTLPFRGSYVDVSCQKTLLEKSGWTVLSADL